MEGLGQRAVQAGLRSLQWLGQAVGVICKSVFKLVVFAKMRSWRTFVVSNKQLLS